MKSLYFASGHLKKWLTETAQGEITYFTISALTLQTAPQWCHHKCLTRQKEINLAQTLSKAQNQMIPFVHLSILVVIAELFLQTKRRKAHLITTGKWLSKKCGLFVSHSRYKAICQRYLQITYRSLPKQHETTIREQGNKRQQQTSILCFTQFSACVLLFRY